MDEYTIQESFSSKLSEAMAIPIKYRVSKNECWEVFSHALTKFGHPTITRNKKSYNIHRYVYMLLGNKIEDSEVLRHKCDNPICCNPAHMETGTQSDNINDMILRGRHNPVTGERNIHSKLTEEDISNIRGMKGIKTLRALGKQYGVCHKTIWNIQHLNKWKCVT